MKALNHAQILFVLFACLTGTASAQWSDNFTENDSIIVWPGDQINPAVISDGNRGAIVVWEDGRFSGVDVYAARLHKSGTLAWRPGGEPIAVEAQEQKVPMIVPNGDGGSFITWQDHRNQDFGSIYAQQIDNLTGQPKWQENGVLVQSESIWPSLIRDGVLGTIVASYVTVFDRKLIAAQKVSSSGTLEWDPFTTPTQDASVASPLLPPAMVSDFNDGAILVWPDIRNAGATDIYASRLDGNGDARWNEPELAFNTSVTNDTHPAVIEDGKGGVIIVWISPQSPGDTNDRILAQNLNGQGQTQWGATGVEISTSSASKRNVKIAQANSDTFIVVWEDLSSGADKNIVARRIDSAGNRVGPLINVSDADGAQNNLVLLANGRGGVIVAWEDNRWEDTRPDIYAQLIESSGTVSWDDNGRAVSVVNDIQVKPVLTHDGLGGAIIVWQDFRNHLDFDIYAQRVSRSSVLGESRTLTIERPLPETNWEIGSEQLIVWNFQGEIDSVSIELSRDGGQTFLPDDVIASSTPNTGSFLWPEVNGQPCSDCVLRTRAVNDEHIETESDPFSISPAVGPSIEADPITEAVVNDSLAFVAASTDLSGVMQVALNYRQGGAPTFISREMLRNEGDEFTNFIPRSDVTNRGLEYFISSTDSIGNTTRTDTFFISVSFGEGEQTREVARATAQTSYRMISAPNLLDVTLADSIFTNSGFGAYDTTSWRLFQFRDSLNVERDSLNAATFRFEPGQAYWIISDQRRTVDFGSGVSMPANEPYEITLQPGWNQIGNPFAFAVDWNDIMAASGEPLVSRPSLYEGEYLSPEGIEPYQGYFVYRFGNTDTTLVFQAPDDTLAAPTLAKPGASADWELRISAVCGDARDVHNLLGIHAKARPEWDRLDQPEPPVIGDYVSVYFPQQDWQRFGGSYTSDYRGEFGQGQIWEFRVATNIVDESMNMAVSGMESLPADIEVILWDEALNISRDLRQAADYAFATGPQGIIKTLKIIAGTSAFVANAAPGLAIVPEEFELAQNFPNPFNPSTSIRFGLPQEEKVTIRIYDILGREVRTLVDDQAYRAGYHIVTWNGRDKLGLPAASGLYIYRISAGTFSQTQKMLLVK